MSNFNPQEVEKEILEYWKIHKIYKKAKEKNKKGEKFYYLDGPPYTSGRIHIGHAWGKDLRDSIMRYKRMRGYDVWDRPGFDMHGLPTSHRVEEKLGIIKSDIGVKVPIADFVKECEALAIKNMDLMIDDFKKLGIWMEWDRPYYSITNDFIEGEWWLIKKAHERKLLYEGFKVMAWCASCGTSLAKHELDYEEVNENSIFIKFPVEGKDKEYLLVWTTTPWTIPFNMGVMVNPELDYIRAKVDDETWIISKGLSAPVIQAVLDKTFEIIEEFKGTALEGLRYRQPFYEEIEYHQKTAKENKNACTVWLSEEYVDLSAGTGLVHSAPGCGPEDYEVGKKYNVPAYNEIDDHGKFPKSMGKFAGLVAKKDDKVFVQALKDKGLLLAETPVSHEYAHCWRCHSPVVYKTTKQWFFDVEKSGLKEKMIEANKSIKWVPDWAGNKWFDSWLRNLKDNGITRQIVWGCPLPIWKCHKCNDYIVIGSADELKRHAGKVPDDLHIPWIDEIEIKCKCGGTMKRLPDTLDVWVDAGTVSWSCLDYPKENANFKKLWPADLILEGKDQIRGWFNLLLVASMVAMEKVPFKAVYMHGFINDAQGRKMSKSLGNIISPYEVLDKYGADTLRYYMIGGAAAGIDINYNFEDMKVKYRNLVVLWNLHRYLIDLAKEAGVNPNKLDEKLMVDMMDVEEFYIMSKLNLIIKETTLLFEDYRLDEIPHVIEDIFLELSRTYIQMIRERLSTGEDTDKQVILFTINAVLMDTLKIFAPLAPFITEKMYLNLKEEFGLKLPSIHHYDWPVAVESRINKDLENSMGVVKDVITAISFGREKSGFGLRWPLKEAIIVTKDPSTVKALEILEGIVKTQTNIKEIKVQETFPNLKLTVKGDFGKIGPQYGPLAPKIIAYMTMHSPQAILQHIETDGKYEFTLEGTNVVLKKEHMIVEKTAPPIYEVVDFSKGTIYLNKERSDALEAEGFAREIMRRIQQLRKEKGMQKSDSISLFVKVDSDLKEFLKPWEKAIKDKVGAKRITISENEPAKPHAHIAKEKIKGHEITVMFDKE